MSATAFPNGPYRFDDISSAREDDGLGYIYLAEGGFSPTLAHTGDKLLSAAVNRALGSLFAAAPDMFEALAEQVAQCFDPTCEMCVRHEAILARARGEA